MAGENILWIGTSGQIEESLVPRAGLRLETIAAGPVAGVSWLDKIVNIAKMTRSVSTANGIMARFKPHVLFMTGGYVNGPVAIAARLRRIPALIYLPDIEPGMAIRWLSRLAEVVAATTETSKRYFPAGKVVVTGYPIREQLRRAAKIEREQALSGFDLVPGRKTLLVTGGSRGARSINRALMRILPQLLDTFQVIHLSGTLDWPEVQANTERLSDAQRAYYRPFPFLHRRMGVAFRSADLVLARAGASMLGECPAFGLPAILVPYPYAWRYQKVNAEYLVEHGAAIMLGDDRLNDQLLPALIDLMSDPYRLEQMADASRNLETPDAEDRLALVIQDLALRGTK